MVELYRLLLASDKFINWRPEPGHTYGIVPVAEKHFTPAELAEAWGVSTETVRSIFRKEPGVLKIGEDATRHRRGYKTLRIPESVAARVHQRMSA
jgi:hypothetical protein